MIRRFNKIVNQITDMYVFLSCIFSILVIYLMQGITWFNFIIYLIAGLTMQKYYLEFKQLKETKSK